jgi:hypothetical protein
MLCSLRFIFTFSDRTLECYESVRQTEYIFSPTKRLKVRQHKRGRAVHILILCVWLNANSSLARKVLNKSL